MATPHRYWRLALPDSAAGDVFAVQALLLRDQVDGPDRCGSGMALCSAADEGFPAAEAFDNEYDTSWKTTGAATAWLGYDFGVGNAYAIVDFVIGTSYTYTTATPGEWVLEWSDDGSAWTELADWQPAPPGDWSLDPYAYRRQVVAGAYWIPSSTGLWWDTSDPPRVPTTVATVPGATLGWSGTVGFGPVVRPLPGATLPLTPYASTLGPLVLTLPGARLPVSTPVLGWRDFEFPETRLWWDTSDPPRVPTTVATVPGATLGWSGTVGFGPVVRPLPGATLPLTPYASTLGPLVLTLPGARLPVSTPVLGWRDFEFPETRLRWTKYTPLSAWELPVGKCPVYFLTLTGAADSLDDVTMPMASFDARVKSGDPSYLQAVVPDAYTYAAAILARINGDLTVRRGYLQDNGDYLTAEIARVHLDTVADDRGPMSASVSLSGTRQDTNTAPKSLNLYGVTYRHAGTGARRVRCTPDTFLRAGDTAVFPELDESMEVGSIAYTVSPGREQMELTEASA